MLVGKLHPGVAPVELAAEAIRASRFTIPGPGRVAKMVAYLDALGVGDAPGVFVFSGNEITDAVRAADLGGDGLATDSSVGVWGPTQNLLANGNATVDTSKTQTTGGGGTLTRQTSGVVVFGATAFQVVCPGGGNGQGLFWNGPSTSRVPVFPNSPYTFSVWLWTTSGTATLNLVLDEYDGTNPGVSVRFNNRGPLTVTTTPQRFRYTLITQPRTRGVSPRVQTDVVETTTFRAGGAQLEQRSYATPYVPSDGVPATRQAAVILAPTTYLDETQGWAAFRVAVP